MITPDQFTIAYGLKTFGTDKYLTVRVTNHSDRALSFVVRYRKVKKDGTITGKHVLHVQNVGPGETMEQDNALYWRLEWKRAEVYEVRVSDDPRIIYDPDSAEAFPASHTITKSLCFVATACLGHDDPVVVFLRSWRDNRLTRTAVGRTIIAAYERVAPTMAAWISRHERSRRLTSFFISAVVRRLPQSWSQAR
jgi:hypothetical protein